MGASELSESGKPDSILTVQLLANKTGSQNVRELGKCSLQGTATLQR